VPLSFRDLLAVAFGKGGVGTSTVTVNPALAARDKRIGLVSGGSEEGSHRACFQRKNAQNFLLSAVIWDRGVR